MDNPFLIIHLLTVIPSLFIGFIVLYVPKGGDTHRVLGRIYVICMLITCISSFFIKSSDGLIRLFDFFGILHLLCIVIIALVIRAIWAIQRGRIARHKKYMICSYVLLVIASLFANLTPNRLMYKVLITVFHILSS